MKKLLLLLLVFVMLLALCACGASDNGEHEHAWNSWHLTEQALIGRPGTEKRICALCAELEARETTQGDYVNSFMDWSLNCFFEIGASHDMHIGQNLVLTNIVESYIAQIITRENNWQMQATVPAAEYLALAEKYFALDADALYRLNPYNLETITVPYQSPVGGLYEVVGYQHKAGNVYTVYFENPYNSVYDCMFAVELEYNLLNGQPNRYISIVRITSIPEDIIK